jgi:putative transposase
MAYDPTKGHEALRRGRASVTGAEYFLTICTEACRAGLTTSPDIALFLLTEIHLMVADHAWRLRCVVIMPDHMHLLVILGERLSLEKSVSRFKAKTSAALRMAGLAWQRNFYDHRVRSGKNRIELFLYIYLNPYHAGLCVRSDRWPWFYCCEKDWGWFQEYLDAGRPLPEWIME